jgi:cell division protein FtsN
MLTEKKKIIFVSAIIGLFLFIAIALPLSLLSSGEKPTASVSGIPKPTQSAETEPPLKQSAQDTQETPVIPPPTQTNAQNVIINQYGAEGGEPSSSKVISNPDGTLTINVLPVVPSQQPPAPQQAAKEKAADTPKQTAPQTPPKPATQTAPPPKQTAPVTPPKQTPAQQTPPKKPTQTDAKTVYNYWIQTGAFSTQARAENARKALKDRGIPDADVNIIQSGVYFRVRVGPYAAKTDAEYWFKLIKNMDGLGESYISQTKK